MKIRALFSALLGALMVFAGNSDAAEERASITVQVDHAGVAVAPTLHGLFFEDINYAADGGLYAELVQNRSFQHSQPLYSWNETARGGAQGRLTAEIDSPLNTNNTRFLRIQVDKAGNGFGAFSSGFDGIALREGETYLFSAYVRQRTGEKTALRVELEDASGRMIAGEQIGDIGREWKKKELALTTKATVTDGRLVLLATQPGAVDVDMVSLFPEKTFRNRRNGLRGDLARMLADVKPGFFRFPGGCIVEGRDVANMYRWKDTIGDVAERKQNWNVWQDRTSPEYNQTYGLGFFEYFQLCEDIGAEPVPIINCGMCCQARQGPLIALDKLAPFVQDALDLIEFANAPAGTEWGAKRAAMGHPKPFHLKFLGVGNEQWQQQYFDRYIVFYNAIKAKHPDIQIISTSGPHPDDPLWRFAWDKFRSGTPADIVDEHYYRPPQWFLEHHDRYDSYDRKGPKIFAGEYAAHDSNRRGNLRSAIAEAAYITGLWRNADVVSMAAYAPLFARVGHVQWRPDLIWFDNTRVFGTPSYYVQLMCSRNRPDTSLPVKVDAPDLQPAPLVGRIGVGTWRTQAEFKDITVARDGEELLQSDFSKGFSGWERHGGNWSVVDGALRQTSEEENIRAFAGDPSWSDYTLSLKARKIGGAEGFLISFASKDPNGVTWWNIGGWANTQHGLEVPGANAPFVPGRIETGRWYDIRVELKGAAVKCYLDGQLIQQAAGNPTRALYAAAGRDKKTGETVLAIANPGHMPMTTRINLVGTKTVAPNAKAIVLTSTGPNEENSLEQPTHVSPREELVRMGGPQFEHVVPPWSFTILRVGND
jgi:alpha-L-arabinofuranosidase